MTQVRVGWRAYVSPVGGSTGTDTDAQAFITAAAITDSVQVSALNTLVTDLKTYGLWTKMKALYPFVGGSAASHKFNLKDPRDLDAAYRLVFNGGWIHSTTGALPNGSNGYADTKFVSNSVFTTANDTHISIYSLSDTPSGNKSHGAYQMSNVQDFALTERNLSGNYSGAIGSEVSPNDYINVPVTDSKGYYLLNRSSSTTLKGYKNGNLLQTKSTTSTNNQLSQRNYYISAINADHTSGATWFNDKMNAFHSIGFSLTETEASNLYTSVQKFQTTLGRHVGTPYVSDPDAVAFLTAAGITDGTQAAAINTLVTRMKADGVWTKMKAIYPFVGGTAASHKWNLKDPRDLDAAYRLVFYGGMTHTNLGMVSNYTTSYASTNLTPSTALSSFYSQHVSVYSQTSTATPANNINSIGEWQDGTRAMVMKVRNLSNVFSWEVGNSVVSVTNNDGRGFYLGSTIANNSIKLYKDNTNVATNTSTFSGSLPSQVQPIGKNENKTFSFATIGDGLTDTDALNFYTAVQAFQTTLGRQVNVPLVSDTDAQAFLNAANITSFQQASAVNKLVVDLKAAGVWTKMKAIYPFVGGSATSHKFNLKDPRDLDAAYRLVFNGGWTHTSTGALPNGTTGYADTKLKPTDMVQNSAHMSTYLRTQLDNGVDMGCSTNYYFFISANQGASQPPRGPLNLYSFSYTGLNLPTQAFYLASRTDSTTNKLYRNTSIISNQTNTSSVPEAYNIYLGAGNRNNSIWQPSAREQAFSSIGDGLTDAEVTALYTAVQTYQTSLGRQVDTPVYNNGLVLNLDASNANSYPGTGTTWFDLAAGNNGALVNGPTYDTINGGSLLFDGINDYVDLGSNFKFVDKDLTLDFWVKCTDNSLSNWHDIIVMATPDQSSAIGLFKSRSGNANGSIQFSFIGNHLYSTLIGTQIVSAGIINLTGVIKKESGLYKLYLYVNGVLDKSLNTTISSYDMNTFTNFFARIGSGGPTYPEIWQGNIYSGKVWSRALSATEILNNFNSTRGRFGL